MGRNPPAHRKLCQRIRSGCRIISGRSIVTGSHTVKIIKIVGDLLVLAGLLVCVAPVVTRMMGNYYLLGFELTTVLLGGIALLLLACVARLELLIRK